MKTLIAIPCMDMVHTGFFRSFLEMEKPDNSAFAIIQNTLIYGARNAIAQNAITEGFDRVLWLDSDMVVPHDLFIRLSEDMDSGKEFVTGVYFARKPPITPVVFDKLWWEVQKDGWVKTGAERLKEIPENSVFEVAGSGFGCVMTSVDLLKRVCDVYGAPFTPLMGIGEDLSFCYRVTQTGGKMWCDSRIKAGHIGQFIYDESVYERRSKNGSGLSFAG